jgi:hypothetical protein
VHDPLERRVVCHNSTVLGPTNLDRLVHLVLFRLPAHLLVERQHADQIDGIVPVAVHNLRGRVEIAVPVDELLRRVVAHPVHARGRHHGGLEVAHLGDRPSPEGLHAGAVADGDEEVLQVVGGVVPPRGDHERPAPEHRRGGEVDEGGLEGPPHRPKGQLERADCRDVHQVGPGDEVLQRLHEPFRRHRGDEEEVLDVPVSPRHGSAPDELQRHHAPEAVPEEDHLPAPVLAARVLDEARQPTEVAGEDLRWLAGHRRGVAEVVRGPEQGVAVAVPGPCQLVSEDLEAPGPGPACRASQAYVRWSVTQSSLLSELAIHTSSSSYG